ncbi:hypothetical protein WN944_024206 [Citrus x changshan-huyou]|uniref:CCHC-type domain-containing protein n=1 Tax=Citrus x changshan-huyou TaxID=2935761 RepID=A0AAP0QBT9_9ROSI
MGFVMLNDLWRTLQGFTVIDLENDFFLVRFKSEIDAQYALTQGPWTILGHYLTVQQWTPHFDSSNVNIENIVAWIRIPGMPLHYYHKRILRMIGNVVGKVIKIDYNTESARRGKFARIAVEISLKKPLCSQFFLDGKLQNIEYENLPIICFNCGIYGHKNDDCPQSNTLKNPTESCENNVAEDNPGGGEEKSSSSEVPVNPSFGPWMIVSRKGRGRVSKEGGYTKHFNRFRDGKSEGGSRFEVLEKEETEEREIALPRNHNVSTTENEQPVTHFKYKTKSNPKTNSTMQKPSVNNAKPQYLNIEHSLSPPAPMHARALPRTLSTNHAPSTDLPVPTTVPTSLDPAKHTAIKFIPPRVEPSSLNAIIDTSQSNLRLAVPTIYFGDHDKPPDDNLAMDDNEENNPDDGNSMDDDSEYDSASVDSRASLEEKDNMEC